VMCAEQGACVRILVGGGTKQTQQADIATAKVRWTDYKRRKAALKKKRDTKKRKKKGKRR
jgi:hypothetical protein